MGDHHIVPKARGGKRRRENIYPRSRWGEEYDQKHNAVHALAGILRPDEFVNVLRYYTDEDGEIRDAFFTVSFVAEIVYVDDVRKEVIREPKNKRKRKARKSAWKILFGNMNGKEAIEWIEREFIKKEWLPAEMERAKQEREERKKKRKSRAGS